jgi:hypothetical protein
MELTSVIILTLLVGNEIQQRKTDERVLTKYEKQKKNDRVNK